MHILSAFFDSVPDSGYRSYTDSNVNNLIHNRGYLEAHHSAQLIQHTEQKAYPMYTGNLLR